MGSTALCDSGPSILSLLAWQLIFMIPPTQTSTRFRRPTHFRAFEKVRSRPVPRVQPAATVVSHLGSGSIFIRWIVRGIASALRLGLKNSPLACLAVDLLDFPNANFQQELTPYAKNWL